jgi:hypothetical protein
MNRNALISGAITAVITGIMTFVARYASPDPLYQLVVASVGMGVVSMLTCVRSEVDAAPVAAGNVQKSQTADLKNDEKGCQTLYIGFRW